MSLRLFNTGLNRTVYILEIKRTVIIYFWSKQDIRRMVGQPQFVQIRGHDSHRAPH
jgi:hypothetical protein